MNTAAKPLAADDVLWLRYRALTPPLKGLLRLKCLALTHTSPHQFASLVKAAGVTTATGRAWPMTGLLEAVQSLQKAGLLTRSETVTDTLLHPVALDTMASEDGGTMVAAVQQVLNPRGGGYYYAYSGVDTQLDGLLRLLRLDIYTNNAASFGANWKSLEAMAGPAPVASAMTKIFMRSPLAADWVASRAPEIRAMLLAAQLSAFLDYNIGAAGIRDVVANARGAVDDPAFAALRPLLVRFSLLSGGFDVLRTDLANPGMTPPDDCLAANAALTFLEGDHAGAVVQYREALKQRRKRLGKRKLYLAAEHRLLFPMALLRADNPALQAELQTGLDVAFAEQSTSFGSQRDAGLYALQILLWIVQGQEVKARETAHAMDKLPPGDPLAAACVALARHAAEPGLSRADSKALTAAFDTYKDTAPLLAGIYAEILAGADTRPGFFKAWLRDTPRGATIEFTRLTGTAEPWERALESLDAMLGANDGKSDKAEQKSKRLAWFLDPETRDVTVAEQASKGRGGWSDGRPVSMKRLHMQDPKLDYLTPADRAVLKTIRRLSSWGGDEFEFDRDRTIVALIGHPAVFDARQRSQALELVGYPVELLVTETKGGYRIALSHTAGEEASVFLEAETPERYRVIDFPKSLLPVQDLLGRDGLQVPSGARDRVVAMAKRGNPTLPVRAEIAELESGVEGESAPVVRLLPQGEGLKVSLMVRPFGADGPAYVAGIGGRSVLATVGGRQTRATRDLPRELAERSALIEACPTLRDRLGADTHDLDIDDLDGSLELLLELRDYTGPVVLEWPEGQKMKVTPVDGGKMKVNVSQERDWFGIGGTVALDGDQVLEMRFLLDRLGSARGRFVKLEDGQFVALTRQLQGQLERLAAVSEPHRNGRRVHAMGAAALEAVLEDAGDVKADAAWKKHIKTIRAAEGWTPRVPDTLQAELRDYQVDGFVWMSRLARWGAGACLADDMGLGKTVQTIALLLDRSAEGPSLVVAPTSVCPNWVSELTRFAPTLTAHRLEGGDRTAKIESMGPRDVLICSYGLLNQTADALGARKWSVAVLDEAQAIKNAETKRAQAVGGLQAGFRLALTGTPVENYLDELWSLFSFVVPGVLGSRDGFQKRFARPIERDRDPAARQALRALIRPFLLRRTKAAVLSELPPRTEQTMHVEMEDGERAFYEALRQQSLERLEALEGLQGKRRVQILAEITRLRRACCNPALIDAGAAVPSGKLTAFMELVEELVKNRPRALVFSQFVGHLDLVRKALDAKGIRYEYLDGSTPSAERERRVASFQAGGADLFLISLRAGGTGLNLTAADYVVHLDPWWNPAVEDQASDRAHRIGQERPVTIYRLIMQDSIEERILALHRDKRDLASDILEGGEVSAGLSEDDLLGLIRG